MSNCNQNQSSGPNANRLFNLADALFGPQAGAASYQWSPPVDVRETENHYEVTAELPGVTGSDVKVVVRDGVMTISGQRPAATDAEGVKTRISERRFGAFQRRFALPKDANGESVSAEFKNGLLLISVAKREEVKPREIEIKVA